MVTIRNYYLNESSEGRKYVSLELIGEIELLQSKESGRFYATVKRCLITSTFDEITAKIMLGKSLSGSIVKQECEPYQYKVPGTGELVSLTHKYVYIP